MRSNAAIISRIIVPVNAFNFSGRCNVIVATRSLTSYRIWVNSWSATGSDRTEVYSDVQEAGGGDARADHPDDRTDAEDDHA